MDITSIKNKVKAFQKGETILVYVSTRKTKGNFEWQRRLRTRTVIRGILFHTYHPEMDFTLALNSGWTEIK